jgi:DNA-binding PadR family transcriptional regulator
MNNSELAILTLLAEAPRHGYEIEQIIERRGMRDWTEIGFSSIYYVLKRLENYFWIVGTYETNIGQGPGRKVFHITKSGNDALHEAALAILQKPERVYRKLDLGLAYLPALPGDEILQSLLHYREDLQQTINQVQERASLEFNQVEHVQIMFDLNLTHYRAELEWLDRTIIRLQRSRK